MRVRYRPIALAVGTSAIVTAANASQGAYFSQSWGWVALAFLVPTTVVLILGSEASPRPLRLAFAVLMLCLAAWIGLSSLWSLSVPGSVRELERAVVYVGAALAIALVLRSTDRAPVLAGVLIGTSLVCAYSLGTRLLPDHLVTHDDPYFENRLGQPLGYPNGLGAFAAIGILVALGFVVHGRRISTAAAAAALLPVLTAVLYFTFSRGAWFALGFSVVAAIAIDSRWLASLWTTALVALPSLALLLVASEQDRLTTYQVIGARAASQGHYVARILIALAVCSAGVAALARWSARRVRVPRVASRAIASGLVVAAAASVVAIVIAVGGPTQAISRVKEGFETLPVTTPDLNGRLFTIYGNGRGEIWPVSVEQFRAAPIVGQGAGSFEYAWYEDRTNGRTLRDAHTLYLEALGEIGLVGVGLLVGVLLVPFIGAVKTRRRRFVPYGIAAYASWAIACAVDWHWEMTGLTLTAILAGGVALLDFDRPLRGSIRRTLRTSGLVVSVGLSIFAVVSLVGNQALFAAKDEVAARDWQGATDDARRARALLPWSFEPDLVLGDAAAGLGDGPGAARAYRDAVDDDPGNWAAWLRLAQVTKGAERRHAYARVHELNPLEENLPGESRSSP